MCNQTRRTADRSWADLYRNKPVRQNRYCRIGKAVSPQPKQCSFGITRVYKALRLFFSTNYNLKMSWNAAKGSI